jgi:hypothetical protein
VICMVILLLVSVMTVFEERKLPLNALQLSFGPERERLVEWFAGSVRSHRA